VHGQSAREDQRDDEGDIDDHAANLPACSAAATRSTSPPRTAWWPSRAVDKAWHGFILCTARYATFCEAAYGRFLHHHPEGSGSGAGGAIEEQLARTVIAWSLVAEPGERCVLWDLDARAGVEAPWGIPPERVAAVESHLGAT
jgi:hypothetical protein